MKTVKYGEVLMCGGVLSKIKDAPMGMKTAFLMGKNFTEIEKLMTEFENTKNDFIKKFGTVTEDGNMEIKQDSPEFIEYVNQINELLSTDVELNISEISLEDWDKLDLKLSMLEVKQLEILIKN